MKIKQFKIAKTEVRVLIAEPDTESVSRII